MVHQRIQVVLRKIRENVKKSLGEATSALLLFFNPLVRISHNRACPVKNANKLFKYVVFIEKCMKKRKYEVCDIQISIKHLNEIF